MGRAVNRRKTGKVRSSLLSAAAFLARDGKRAVYLASADPLGTNPSASCQLFSVGVHGGVPRQITQLDPGFVGAGCYIPWGIGYGLYRAITQDPVTSTVVFNSTLDALELRPYTTLPRETSIRSSRSGPTGVGFAS